VQARARQPAGQCLHVRERHELILANRHQRHGHRDATRVHGVQVDRFRQAQKMTRADSALRSRARVP